MKVNELFEAQGSPGQGGKLKGGAYYKPTYLADKGQIRGSVRDWLDAMGATPQDVQKALARVKGSPLFRNELPAAGLEYQNKPESEKRGTLVFKVNRKWSWGGKTHVARTGYNVYANGQLRATGQEHSLGQHMTPLKTPKPRLKAGDPVASITMTMTAALEEMLAKWKKAVEKMDREEAREKAKATKDAK